jgi:hypothetical protein
MLRTACSDELLMMLPQAAQAARREIAAALGGCSRASLKARVILREAYEGKIRLVPDVNGGLVAHWNLQTAALLRIGTVGSGGPLREFPTGHSPSMIGNRVGSAVARLGSLILEILHNAPGRNRRISAKSRKSLNFIY